MATIPTPFFTSTDWLGDHSYFRTPADAEAYMGVYGGELHETSPGLLWRVTRAKVSA